jgi:hypothetical protein
MKLIPEDKLFKDVAQCEEVHRPSRNSVLKILRDHDFKVGVEIGIQYGQNADRLLQHGVVHTLYGIDPYRTEVGTITPLNDKSRDNEVYGFALGKLDKYGDRYIHIKKPSNEAILDIDGQIDCIYIDGGNTKQNVYDDISYWYPKIREGGIMVGHNYGHSSFLHTKEVVDKYFGLIPHLEEGYVWWRQKLDYRYHLQDKVSVVTPFYNTIYYYDKYITGLLEDDRIDEIIIVDDHSDQDQYEGLVVLAKHPKIKLVRNEENLGEFKTRIKGAEIAKNDWVVFLDSDNSLTESYLDKLFEIPHWREDVIYHADFGNIHHINYESLAGNYLGTHNIARFLTEKRYMISMFLNTGNYFMNRKKYLEVAKPVSYIAKHAYGDIWFNRHWFKSGGKIFVVPGMKYVHRRRKDSVWREYQKEMQPIIDETLALLANG